MSNQPQAHVADERAEFEAWVQTWAPYGLTRQNKNGPYNASKIQSAWMGWQARNSRFPVPTSADVHALRNALEHYTSNAARAASTQGADVASLAEFGALRQLKHNDGSEGFVMAYDYETTNRYIAMLRARLAAGAPAETPKQGFEAWWFGRGLPDNLKAAFFMVWKAALEDGEPAAQPSPATEAQGQAGATDA